MRKVVLLAIVCTLLALAVIASGDPCVRLRYATFDPLAGQPSIAADLRADLRVGEPTAYIVQFTGPIEEQWKAELELLGVEVLDYLPDFCFIVRVTPEVSDKVAGLKNVRWVGPFHPAYRVSPDLLNPTGPVRTDIRLFPGHGHGALGKEISRLGGLLQRGASHPEGDSLEAVIPAHVVRRIARRHDVAWMEPKLEYKLCNDVGRGLMTVPAVWSDYGLYGAGEIVAICDTGLDTGNFSTVSPDLSGRIVSVYTLGRNSKWDDPNGHGTHVAGSVLGNGTRSGSNPAAHNYSTSFAGAAPEAELVFQSVLDNSGGLGGIPSDLTQLFQPPYNDGARVHSNSWGSAYNGVYTSDSREVDLFTWNNRDMVIVVAAGNEGLDANSDGVVDQDSMNSPSTAKNCITVGATENYRLSGGAQSTYGAYWASDFPVSPISTDKVSNNSSGMAAFSGRGPCDDGRIKPDVCAPGTNVLSCRSHVTGASTLWGTYNTDYLYCGGTSMATPLTAGAAALVREYYRTQFGIAPSAALVKATLINGAKDVAPGQYGTGSYLEIPTRPNNVEGWGLVDLAYSLIPTGQREIEHVDYTAGLSTGGSWSRDYTIAASTDPLRVTLVWTDYPAAAWAGVALVNDLDLTVILPDGQVRRGNGMVDRRNNVEGVDISPTPSGTYTVTVSGYNVPYGPQPFALVVSGDMGIALPTVAITKPESNVTLYGPVTIEGTASGFSFEDYSLEYGAGASPTSWNPIAPPQTEQVIDGLLGTWDTTGLPDGVYTVRLTARNPAGSSTTSVTVNVLKTSVKQVKDNPNLTPVTLTGKVVTAGKAHFGVYMYVQEPDRSSGIRVTPGSTQPDAPIGSIVTITGTLGTTSGERVIAGPTITITGSTTAPKPVAMPNRDLGGTNQGSYTPGVTNGRGVNNLCLLVSAFGRVTYIGSNYFYMDDGCGLLDGSGQRGIKVYTGALTKPTSTSQYARVTGISGAEISGSTTRRLLRPRMQTDLVYY